MTIHQRRDDYPNPWRIQMRGHPARRKSIAHQRSDRRELIAVARQGARPDEPRRPLRVCARRLPPCRGQFVSECRNSRVVWFR